MAATPPNFMPQSLIAGDTLVFNRTFPDYPPSGGWSLSYVLRNAAQNYTFTATNTGDTYNIVVPAATTVSWTPGLYQWIARVTGAGGTFTVDQGSAFLVTPDLASAASGTDFRAHAQKVVDAIEAVLAGKATNDQLSFSIGNRQLHRFTFKELMDTRAAYKAEIDRAIRDEKIKRGQGTGRQVKARFGGNAYPRIFPFPQ